MSEKRKESRIEKKVKAEVHDPAGMTYSTTIDISTGGIFISSPEPHKPGTDLEISLKIDDSSFLSVKGLVRWKKELEESDEYGMGIEFVDIDPESLKKIEKFLAN